MNIMQSEPYSCVPCKYYECSFETLPCRYCRDHDHFEEKMKTSTSMNPELNKIVSEYSICAISIKYDGSNKLGIAQDIALKAITCTEAPEKELAGTKSKIVSDFDVCWLIQRGVRLMTLEQLSSWEGVRAVVELMDAYCGKCPHFSSCQDQGEAPNALNACQ